MAKGDNTDLNELYETMEKIFLDQLGLNLSEAVENDNGKYTLKIELMGLSMASINLSLSKEEHGLMAQFLEELKKVQNF